MVLDEKGIKAVSELLEPVNAPVELLFFVSDDAKHCDTVEELLNDLKSLEKIEFDKLKIDSDQGKKLGVGHHAPTIVFKDMPRIRITGVPSGHEFRGFLETILMVSKGETNLSNDVKKELAKITENVFIQVFVTPTCPYCAPMVFSAHQFALENKHITSRMVEAVEFPDLVKTNQVSGVPKVVINEMVDKSFEGNVPEHIFVKKILESL